MRGGGDSFLLWNHRLVRVDVLVLVVGSLLPLPRYSGGFCLLVPPPAAYFPAKESRQSSPGLRARTRGWGAAE